MNFLTICFSLMLLSFQLIISIDWFSLQVIFIFFIVTIMIYSIIIVVLVTVIIRCHHLCHFLHFQTFSHLLLREYFTISWFITTVCIILSSNQFLSEVWKLYLIVLFYLIDITILFPIDYHPVIIFNQFNHCFNSMLYLLFTI